MKIVVEGIILGFGVVPMSFIRSVCSRFDFKRIEYMFFVVSEVMEGVGRVNVLHQVEVV